MIDLPPPLPIIEHVIVDDRGGLIAPYIFDSKIRNTRGDKIMILGTCASACTIFISSENVCVGPHARLMFHQARNYVDGKRNEKITSYLFEQYPYQVQEYILSKGGLTSEWIVLQGEKLREMFPAC